MAELTPENFKTRKYPENNQGQEFKLWHHSIAGTPAIDIDLIQLKRVPDGDMQPVAVIETTECTLGSRVSPNCLDKIAERLATSTQRRIVLSVAGALKIPAYLVVTRPGLTEFYVCKMDDEQLGKWTHYTDRNAMGKFLVGLGA